MNVDFFGLLQVGLKLFRINYVNSILANKIKSAFLILVGIKTFEGFII